MATKKTSSTAPKNAAGSVSKTEFGAFQTEVRDAIGGLTTVLEGIADKLNTPAAPALAQKEEGMRVTGSDSRRRPNQVSDGNDGGPSYERTPMPAKYDKIVDKYFDREDGFEFFLEGINFTISVPDHISNMESAYKLLYKVDHRTKALPPHNFEAGIEDWCKRVTTNLKYDRKAARK